MQADRRSPREAGFTLVELLVYTLLLGIVLAAAFGLLISMTRAVSRTDTATQGTDQARLAVTQIDRQVRSGNVLYNPNNENSPADGVYPGFTLRVYTQANGEQKCVQWMVNTDGELLTRSWSETYAIDHEVTPWVTVARNIVNHPVAVGAQPTTKPFSLPGGFGERLLQLSFIANVNPKTNKNVQFETTIAGRNTEYGYSPFICNTIPPY